MPDLSALPLPSFIDRDSVAIVAACVQAYEAAGGRALQPAQPERLEVDLIAYREHLVRLAVQDAALQCLPRFARFPILDYHGERFGVTRLPPQAALATFRATLAAPQGVPHVIPAGSLRIASKDARVVFTTRTDLVIPVGATSADAEGMAEVAGPQGNGYLPGEVASLLTPRPLLASVTNLGTTYGGQEGEDDDHLRMRILKAPERFTTAGSRESYRWAAMSAHAGIVDVAVIGSAGHVDLYVLMRDGLPSQEVLDLVAASVSSEKVRPICDEAAVHAPVRVPYRIRAGITFRRGTDLQAGLEAAQRAGEAFAAERGKRLGLDLVPAQLVAALMVGGAYSVDLHEPGLLVLAGHQWADCEAVEIQLAGVADD